MSTGDGDRATAHMAGCLSLDRASLGDAARTRRRRRRRRAGFSAPVPVVGARRRLRGGAGSGSRVVASRPRSLGDVTASAHKRPRCLTLILKAGQSQWVTPRKVASSAHAQNPVLPRAWFFVSSVSARPRASHTDPGLEHSPFFFFLIRFRVCLRLS